MGKLYFKKLLSGVKYTLVFFIIYIFGANVLVTIANFFKEMPVLQLLVLMGIPALIVFVWGSLKRVKDKERGKAYKKELGQKLGEMSYELPYIFKSLDYRAELISGATYAILISALLNLPGNVTPMPIRLLNFAIYLVLIFVVYALGDFLSWLWVHHKYRKDDLL